MSYPKALTFPNLRDTLPQEVLERVDRILADLRFEMRPLRDEYHVGKQSIVRNALHNKKREMAAVEKLLEILSDEYLAGCFGADTEAYCLDVDNLSCRFRTLRDDVHVLRTSGHEIEDRLHDDTGRKMSNGSISVFTCVDETYVDSLIDLYKTLNEAKAAISAEEDTVAAENAEISDSLDEIEIDGEIEVEEEDDDGWEEVEDEYEWGDGWFDLDEEIDEEIDDY
jgi:hypothetical protein